MFCQIQTDLGQQSSLSTSGWARENTQLTFSETFVTDRIPDAYERLLWEVMKGNQYLFVRRDEVEYAWRWVDQVIRNWKDGGEPPKRYAAGTWGPVASIAMITRDGRSWYEDV